MNAKQSKAKPQSGVVPWRKNGKGIEVLLVTSRDTARWVIPKGSLEPDMTPAQSAVKEAEEEAGVKGKVSNKSIGDYTYFKTARKGGEYCRVEVFTMKVTDVQSKWPEMNERTRKWMTPEQASKRVNEKDLRKLLASLRDKLS